ncbi:MAG TPA: Xaa-Pro peptidase family protein [Acidimicrobiales bacterium]|nr:Xaa-Pro peptidase family protein [Acidimicrobiales bacterium]
MSASQASLAKALPPMDYRGRADALRTAMEGAGCEALLVSKVVNVRYLTGFSGSAAMLLLTPGDVILVTDGRYQAQAQEELARSGAPARLEAAPVAEQQDLLSDLTAAFGTVGVEAEHVSWARQRALEQGWGRRKALVPTMGLVERLRERKCAGEVARIAAACTIADRALAAVEGMLEERPSEVEVAVALDAEMRRLGAEGLAFETIVASGPNAALPHHSPSPRRVRPGELLVVDFGARVEGYRSDMTRTFAPGGNGAGVARARGELARISHVVLASQDAGLSAVREGASGGEVDRACREVVEAAGLGDFFVHGTGHGVGLEIHEAPSLAKPSKDILSTGQVLTVEPGVYIPGLGGARTEDTVLVTDAGCELLTMSPKLSQRAAAASWAGRRQGRAPKMAGYGRRVTNL